MSLANSVAEKHAFQSGSVLKSSDRNVETAKDKSYDKTVDIVPQPDAWRPVAAGSMVPLGMAAAAAVATRITTHERVAIAAWIAVAVVGSASVISAATVSRRRTVAIDRGDQGTRSVAHNNDVSRIKDDEFSRSR
jgi:hypothetical protein